MKLEVGKRYLIKLSVISALSEVEVLEISPQGRVKCRDLGSGSVYWLDLDSVQKLQVVEVLPDRFGAPQNLEHRIVRE